MIEVVRSIEQNKRGLRDINIEVASAALTARMAPGNVAITTAGYIIPFAVIVRNQAFTINLSGTNITFPTGGYYTIALPVRVATNNLWMQCRLIINGVNFVTSSVMYTPVTTVQTFFSFNFTRYFNLNDILQIQIVPQINTNYLNTAEGLFGESGHVNIVQLTGAIE
jgi:hypothetical protein